VDDIELVAPDPTWPAQFRHEAERVIALIGAGRVLAFEHVGSTAIPDLAAKPIIDMMALLRDVQDGLAAVPALESIGYSFWRDNPRRDRLFLVKGLPPSAPRRTHHLHMLADAAELRRHTLFRDYLRAHPHEATAYLALKRDLARRFEHDREAYTDGKDDHVAGVLSRAVIWEMQRD
jgi:GrpB-like predicted nucleotidyltransferase (UPF0157 family)